MFAIVQNGNIQQLIPDGSQFTVDGVEYPSNWVNLSTPEEKAAIGMVDVIYGPQANQTYYWVTENAPVYNAQTNQVDITFTSTPKDLTQVKQVAVQSVNDAAYSILLPSDWMVVKAVETQTSINPTWGGWRQTIRIEAANAVTAINAATDVDGVAAVQVNWTPDPSQPTSPVTPDNV